MHGKTDASLRKNSPYSGVLTREQFLFYETRLVARLRSDGLNDEAIIERIAKENLFQYPTERTVRNIARTCIHRLDALKDESLVTAIATQPADVSKQICLYAMMKRYRLVWEFMVTVIGAKYASCDMSFSKREVNAFMMRLQEQDDWVASWSDNTIERIGQVLVNILVENEYLDSGRSGHLNPVLIVPILEDAIRTGGDTRALLAFNCLS